MVDFDTVEKEFSFPFDNLEKKIVYLYYVKRYSIRQVCEELRCANTTVNKALNNTFGVRSTQQAHALRTTDEYREKIRQTKIGDKNHQAKLTESDVLAIREQYLKLQGTFTKTQAQHLLAEDYGVKRPTISDIVLRKTWKHI